MYPYRAAHTLSTILRKAEGSRGGHIIGHTKSGWPIYAATHFTNAEARSIERTPDGHGAVSQSKLRSAAAIRGNTNYTAQDHHDAFEAHSKNSKEPHDVHAMVALGHKHARDSKLPAGP